MMLRCRQCGKQFEEDEGAKSPAAALGEVYIPSPRAGEGQGEGGIG